jgi:hypothetical protein
MSRKVGISVVLETDQIDWLEEQDESISAQVRECIEIAREGGNDDVAYCPDCLANNAGGQG